MYSFIKIERPNFSQKKISWRLLSTHPLIVHCTKFESYGEKIREGSAVEPQPGSKLL